MTSVLKYTQGKSLCLPTAPDSVRGFIQDLPLSWQTEGLILKKGSRSTVKLVTLEQQSYVVKIYKKMPLHRRLRYALTKSRAFQSWDCGQLMCAANLPVARPLAIIEERTFGIPGRAALLMEAASGDDLLSIVNNNTLSDDELKTVASKLENTFDRMRDLKITHGDMKATNILVDENLELKLIDIDAAKQHCSSSRFLKAKEKDRLRFLANWKNKPLALDIFGSVYS